jgi:hypothetical protein
LRLSKNDVSTNSPMLEEEEEDDEGGEEFDGEQKKWGCVRG